MGVLSWIVLFRAGRLVFPPWLIVWNIFTSTNRATDWSFSRRVIKIIASYATNFIINSSYSISSSKKNKEAAVPFPLLLLFIVFQIKPIYCIDSSYLYCYWRRQYSLNLYLKFFLDFLIRVQLNSSNLRELMCNNQESGWIPKAMKIDKMVTLTQFNKSWKNS